MSRRLCAGLTEPLLRGSGHFQALPYLPWGSLETALSGEGDTGVCDLGKPGAKNHSKSPEESSLLF